MDPKTTNSLIIELLQYEDDVEDGLAALAHFLSELGAFNHASSTDILFAESFAPQVFFSSIVRLASLILPSPLPLSYKTHKPCHPEHG